MRENERTFPAACSRLPGAEQTCSTTATPTRPTLDAFVEALCGDIRNRARLRRPLPLPKSAARVDELLGASAGLVRGGAR